MCLRWPGSLPCQDTAGMHNLCVLSWQWHEVVPSLPLSYKCLGKPPLFLEGSQRHYKLTWICCILRLLLGELCCNAALRQLSCLLFRWSSISQVVKFYLQKYCPGMPGVCISSLNVSFFNPTNLLVLMSTTTSEIIWGSRVLDISRMGNITLHTCPPYPYHVPLGFSDRLSRRLELRFPLAFVLVE